MQGRYHRAASPPVIVPLRPHDGNCKAYGQWAAANLKVSRNYPDCLHVSQSFRPTDLYLTRSYWMSVPLCLRWFKSKHRGTKKCHMWLECALPQRHSHSRRCIIIRVIQKVCLLQSTDVYICFPVSHLTELLLPLTPRLLQKHFPNLRQLHATAAPTLPPSRARQHRAGPPTSPEDQQVSTVNSVFSWCSFSIQPAGGSTTPPNRRCKVECRI